MIRAWGVVLLCSVLMLVSSGPVYYAYGNYSVAFAHDFQASRAIINIGFTVVGIVGSLGSAPIGVALDRWGFRRVACFGLIGSAAGFWLVSLATGIWQIVILFGTLIAMADICIGVVVTSYLVSHWFERRRGLALGLSVLGASAAAIAFPPLTNALIAGHGWRATFGIYAMMMLALVPPVLLWGQAPSALPESERAARKTEANGQAVSIAHLFHTRSFWVLSFVTGVMVGANTGTMVSLVPFGTTRGLSTAQGSLLLSTLGATAIVGKILIGISIDRLSHRAALFLGVGCQLAGMLLLAIATSYPAMIAGVAIFGLGVGAMLPVWGAALAAMFGLSGYGRALGWSRALMTPISLIFPLLAGALFDRTGDYRSTWMCFALLLTTAGAALFALAPATGKRGAA